MSYLEVLYLIILSVYVIHVPSFVSVLSVSQM